MRSLELDSQPHDLKIIDCYPVKVSMEDIELDNQTFAAFVRRRMRMPRLSARHK